MPGPENFLRSFSERQTSPPPGFIFDDEGNLFSEPVESDLGYTSPVTVPVSERLRSVFQETNPIDIARRIQQQQANPLDIARRIQQQANTQSERTSNMNAPERSIFDPRAIRETYTRAFNDPRRVKQEIVAESMARFNSIPNLDDPDVFRTVGPQIAEDVLREAKSQGLDPYQDWRNRTTIRDLANAEEFINDTKQVFSGFGRAASSPLNKLKDIRSSVGNFVEGLRLPGFIANPLALRSPVVQGTDLVQAGSLVNPQAVKFIRDFNPKKTSYGTDFNSPFGTTVQLANPSGSRYYDVAFQGPFGYQQKGTAKKRMKSELQQADYFESQGDIDEANRIRDRVMNMKEMLDEPLRSPALRYTLGEALQAVPVGGTVTAAPIGAQKGARARIYSSLTNDALATFKGVTPNPNQLPTDEEFRAAAQGEGYQLADLAPINRNRGRIITDRLSPTTWRNVNKEERTFDPRTLKDEMIRATYNLPASTDVSQLRDNPLGLFERTNRIDFTRPVITTESPVYKFRKGLKGGIGIGAADFIPTPEAIRDVYAGQPLNALQRTGQNIVQGLPLAAAIGGTVAAAPALAPLAGATGTALAVNALGAAGNEIVRQQTGEGIIPKIRQFLGTAERTGTANRAQPTRPAVTPRLVRTAPVNPIVQQIQNRLGLAGARFNPVRGEFGLSELLFGR